MFLGVRHALLPHLVERVTNAQERLRGRLFHYLLLFKTNKLEVTTVSEQCRFFRDECHQRQSFAFCYMYTVGWLHWT